MAIENKKTIEKRIYLRFLGTSSKTTSDNSTPRIEKTWSLEKDKESPFFSKNLTISSEMDILLNKENLDKKNGARLNLSKQELLDCSNIEIVTDSFGFINFLSFIYTLILEHKMDSKIILDKISRIQINVPTTKIDSSHILPPLAVAINISKLTSNNGGESPSAINYLKNIRQAIKMPYPENTEQKSHIALGRKKAIFPNAKVSAIVSEADMMLGHNKKYIWGFEDYLKEVEKLLKEMSDKINLYTVDCGHLACCSVGKLENVNNTSKKSEAVTIGEKPLNRVSFSYSNSPQSQKNPTTPNNSPQNQKYSATPNKNNQSPIFHTPSPQKEAKPLGQSDDSRTRPNSIVHLLKIAPIQFMSKLKKPDYFKKDEVTIIHEGKEYAARSQGCCF